MVYEQKTWGFIVIVNQTTWMAVSASQTIRVIVVVVVVVVVILAVVVVVVVALGVVPECLCL